MSRLIEKLKRVSNSSVSPIGFRSIKDEESLPRMLLIQNLTQGIEKKELDLSQSDADAVILNFPAKNLHDLLKYIKNQDKVPLGIFLSCVERGEAYENVLASFDFVVFDMNSRIDIILSQDIGKVLTLNKDVNPNIIRAVNRLEPTVDCIHIPCLEQDITFELLLTCHFVNEVLRKPIILSVKRYISSVELRLIHEAGVMALVLPSTLDSKAVQSLRSEIATLPRRLKKKADAHPVLPVLNVASGPVPSEEPDEDEEIE